MPAPALRPATPSCGCLRSGCFFQATWWSTGLAYTRDFIRGLYASARQGVRAGKSLREVYALVRKRMDPVYARYPIYDCLPFDVSRAYDEAKGIKHPRIWTAQRDQSMWRAIESK
jgi:hypothetical protein